MITTTSESLSQLDISEQLKYVTLEPIYGEKALEILNGLNDRGKNSYSSLMDKIEFFEKGLTPELEEYYDALYAEFVLDVETNTVDIVRKVTGVRRRLELPAYKSKLKLKCEGDFCRIFVFKELPQKDLDNSKVHSEQASRFIPYARIKPN